MTTDRGHGEFVRVAVGVDGSDSARQAAVWAAREAEARDVPLTVLHACGAPEGPQAADAKALVETVAAEIRDLYPELALETELSPLAPVERLLEMGGQGALIVTGTRGHGGFAGTLLGSVSRPLACHCHGALVVVRGRQAAREQGPVVLGVAAEPAESAVEFAFAAAQRYGASVRAMRAHIPCPEVPQAPMLMPAGLGLRGYRPPVADHAREQQVQAVRDQTAEREVAEVGEAIAAARERYPGVNVGVTAAEGSPAQILNAAGERARLVVIGAPHHHRRIPVGAAPGHVAGKLLAHCPAPVAVVA